MALVALSLPILPGKKAKWQEMIDKISEGPMKARMDAVRRGAGVRERSFLQEGPHGDVVIVTIEGDRPLEAFGEMMADPSMTEFAEWAAEVHGMNPGASPPSPMLIYDSEA